MSGPPLAMETDPSRCLRPVTVVRSRRIGPNPSDRQGGGPVTLDHRDADRVRRLVVLVDGPMKGAAIVETSIHVSEKVGDSYRSPVGIDLQADQAHFGEDLNLDGGVGFLS